VNHSWTLVVSRDSAPALARLRRIPRLEVYEGSGEIWLRGDETTDEINRQLQLVPGGRRLAIQGDGQTIAHGRRVPLGYLPDGPWTPLAEWLRVTLPAVCSPSADHRDAEMARVRLTLVPSGQVREASLLETSLASWQRYVATAPQWRIDRWTFVASRDGQVLVRGTPLPPIAGTQWVLEEGIGVRAGLAWSPPLDARTLRQVLQLAAGESALLRSDGSWDRIAADDWVRASRSAALATSEVLGP